MQIPWFPSPISHSFCQTFLLAGVSFIRLQRERSINSEENVPVRGVCYSHFFFCGKETVKRDGMGLQTLSESFPPYFSKVYSKVAVLFV